MTFPFATGDPLLASEANEMYPAINFIFRYQTSAVLQFGATDDGRFLYTTGVNASEINIKRFQIYRGSLLEEDGNNLEQYFQSTTNYKNAEGIAFLDDYIYIWAQKVSDSLWYLLRIDPNDAPQTNSFTEMTVSGEAPGAAANTISSDGVYIYIVDYTQSNVTCRRYSVSGTTITFVSSITLPDYVSYGFGVLNGAIYFATGTGVPTVRNYTIYKTDLSGNIIYLKNSYMHQGTSLIYSFFSHKNTLYALASMPITSAGGAGVRVVSFGQA